MEFAEFREKYADYSAYLNWITVRKAKNLEIIPSKFHDVFKDRCECGSENIISRTLTQEMCCDPSCIIKTGYRLAKMFTNYGVDGLGYATCSDIYKNMLSYDKYLKEHGREGLFMYDVYTEVLLVPWEKYPSSVKCTVAGDIFYTGCLKIKATRTTFSKMVGNLGLAGLDTSTDRIFGEVNSFTEWKNKVVSEGGLIRYCAHRGVSSPEIMCNIAQAVKSIAIADFAISSSIRSTGLYELPVCLTGRVQLHNECVTKARFVELCNELCTDDQGVQLLEVKSTSGAVKAPFVLHTGRSSSAKFMTGLNRGTITDEFGEHEVLMDTTNFYDWLKGAMLIWNENLKQDNNLGNFCKILQEELSKRQNS